jgi:serine/threonine-protein kinase HipA
VHSTPTFDSFVARNIHRSTAKRSVSFSTRHRIGGAECCCSDERLCPGGSYLEIVALLARSGAHAARDLEQLWRRIVLFVCVSNVDDHLRNHGFILEPNGWSLAPAYDMNPVPHGDGLTLNISETDGAQDLELVREVAPQFRIKTPRARTIIDEVITAVQTWRDEAASRRIPRAERDRMEHAFRLAED